MTGLSTHEVPSITSMMDSFHTSFFQCYVVIRFPKIYKVLKGVDESYI